MATIDRKHIKSDKTKKHTTFEQKGGDYVFASATSSKK